MRKIYLAGLLAAALVSACGGGDGDGDGGPAKPVFGAQITFGDSLSDVGSYRVGTIAALKGGQFTINGDNTAINPALTGKNWTEVLATRLNLPAPCAAQTGLDGDASQGFSVPIVNHPGCLGYAQGGARVTNPVGPSNKLTGSALGALTVPVTRQISNHLAATGGKFKPDDMVLVMAGGNDLLFQLAALQAGATAAGTAAGAAAGAKAFDANLVAAFAAGAPNPATAAPSIKLAVDTARAAPGATTAKIVGAAVNAAVIAGNTAVASPAEYGPLVAKAQADATLTGNAAGTKAGADYIPLHSPDLMMAMLTAAKELAALVKTQILANGAQYVTVNNLPDVAATPSGRAQPEEIRSLITSMVVVFNAELERVLLGEARVVLVDAYVLSRDTAARPQAYGLTNVTETACDLAPAKNPLGSSLACNGSNLKSGDVSHYAYADDVHPTPYYHSLLASHVVDKLKARGWL